MRSVIVPGSYDPVTLGHLALIRHASELYDEVYAVIFVNPDKEYKFSLEDRVKMLMLATDDLDNVLVSYSDGLVIDYMRDHGIDRIMKGYRNDTDLEYEREMAEWNFSHSGYETELWRCPADIEKISSTQARENFEKGAELDKILPKSVIEFLSKY